MEDNIILKDQITIDEILKEEFEKFEESNKEEKINEHSAIESIEVLDWYIRTINEKKKKQEKVKEYVKRKIELLKKFEKQQANYNDTTNLKLKLRDHLLTERKKDKKYILATEHGTFVYKKLRKSRIRDEKEVIEYIRKNNPEILESVIKEKVSKSAFDEIFKDGIDVETGEIVPGVEVDETESMYINEK